MHVSALSGPMCMCLCYTCSYMLEHSMKNTIFSSFTLPQLCCAISASQTHKHTSHLLIPTHSLPPFPSKPLDSACYPLSTTQTETNSACCSTPSWYVGRGRWSPFSFLSYNLPTLFLVPLALPPSLLPNISSTRLVYQQGSWTA